MIRLDDSRQSKEQSFTAKMVIYEFYNHISGDLCHISLISKQHEGPSVIFKHAFILFLFIFVMNWVENLTSTVQTAELVSAGNNLFFFGH